MKVIDNKAFKTGEVIRVNSYRTWIVKWHNGDRCGLTPLDRKEKFYGKPRYEVIDD